MNLYGARHHRHTPLVGALLIAATLMTGCSGYRTALLPGDDSVARVHEEPVELYVGQSARVHLKTGAEEEGEVLEVTDRKLILGRPSNLGYQRMAFPLRDIESVEVRHDDKTATAVFLSIAGLAVLAGLIGAGIAFGMNGVGGS